MYTDELEVFNRQLLREVLSVEQEHRAEASPMDSSQMPRLGRHEEWRVPLLYRVWFRWEDCKAHLK